MPEQIAARVPDAEPAPEGLDGGALYGARCAACHGALASSAVRGRTATQIAGAIGVVTSMASLKDLSGAELDAVAAALR